MGRGGRRAPPVCGRVVRCRDVGDRRDVRAPPPSGCRRACARLSPWRHRRAAVLDPEGMLGALFRTMKAFAPPPPPAPSPAAVGQRGAPAGAVGDRVEFRTLGATCSRSRPSNARATTASTSRPTTGRRSQPGPTPPAAGARPSSTRRWTGSVTVEPRRPHSTRFEKEYLLAVGTRTGDSLSSEYRIRVLARRRLARHSKPNVPPRNRQSPRSPIRRAVHWTVGDPAVAVRRILAMDGSRTERALQ